METTEQILRERTYKEKGLELEKRVFYTLTDVEGITTNRVAKMVSLLIKNLREKDIISETEIDTLLLEISG